MKIASKSRRAFSAISCIAWTDDDDGRRGEDDDVGDDFGTVGRVEKRYWRK